MKLLQALVILTLCLTVDLYFPLYESDQHTAEHRVWFDCLYAHVVDESKDGWEKYVRNSHLTPYCRRPTVDNGSDDDPSLSLLNEHVAQRISFKELFAKNITGEHLLHWSIPIDIAERYERDHGKVNEVLYNCTPPWFGPLCQYLFDGSVVARFGDIVRNSFAHRSLNVDLINTGTCYSFLPTCQRGLWPLCLDWREICDDKLDCLNGEDEQGCEVLQTTTCPNDQYRCHYGGQCIPVEFLRDSQYSIDCLDGSDEKEPPTMPEQSFNIECIDIPTFRCEERMGRYARSFPCGDGEYSSRSVIPTPRYLCRNQRDRKMTEVLMKSFDYIPNQKCREALFCALHANRSFGFNHEFFEIGDDHIIYEGECEPLFIHCFTDWIIIPQVPMFFGFFQLLYFTNRSVIEFQRNIAPDIICFLIEQCPVFQSCPIQHRLNDRVACCRAKDLIGPALIYDFTDMFKTFVNLNRMCTQLGVDRSCTNTSFFHCERSSKCISTYRVADGSVDCYYGEDELFPACHFNHSHRFICKSNSTKCLSAVALGNQRIECPGREDERPFVGLTQLTTPLYPYLCDYYYDDVEIGREESDEHDCEYWPCDTVYSRCNMLWNCANGLDELGCPYSRCGSHEHECFNPFNRHEYVCLPLENLYEKYLDGCKNKDFSRTIVFDNSTNGIYEYASWKAFKCITSNLLCRNQSPQLNNSDEVCMRDSNLIPQIHQPMFMDKNKTRICFLPGNYINRPGPFLNPSRFGFFPSMKNGSFNITTTTTMRVTDNSTISEDDLNEVSDSVIHFKSLWFCHRGILVRSDANRTLQCLCPPSYFGDRCQWQSQRVSLTIQIISRSLSLNPLVFQVIILLIDQFGHISPNLEQVMYVPMLHCMTKFNLYLLYPDRPKNSSLIYSIYIDIFERITMTYWGSWLFPIEFSFLPVNRLVVQLFIPDRQQIDSCPLDCGLHGRCTKYINQESRYFCHCETGYSGIRCNQTHTCYCSNDSLCLSSRLCLCPLNKFGPQCYLQRSICRDHNNPCQHGGLCVPHDDRISLDGFSCFCKTGYSGLRCELMDPHIRIDMKTIATNEHSTVFIHLITALRTYKHQQTVIFTKIPFDQHTIALYINQPFHLLFIELMNKQFYLAITRETFIASESINTSVTLKQKCVHIKEILNSTLLNYGLHRRAKYYPLVCRQNPMLTCFYDEVFMCKCDLDRFANCFDFNHNNSYDCQGFRVCQNGGRCFQNNETCPTKFICLCPECFYGTKCQFSTRTFTIALDPIIGYYIKPNVPLRRQPSLIKVSVALVMLISIAGAISGLLLIWALYESSFREFGCRYYVFMSSIFSILTIVMLATKFWHLIFSQMGLVKNRAWLTWNCYVIDVLLKIFMTCNEWLNACVSIDRTRILRFGLAVDENASKRTAKRISLAMFIIVTMTYIHDPLHRQLIDDLDVDEARTWCFAKFSGATNVFNVFITIFHVVVPFSINLISAVIILFLLARIYSKNQPEDTFQQHLRRQFRQHKHLICSPFLLVIFGLPRLIIACMTGCMKSPKEPWFFLFGYLAAFIPSSVTFVIFMSSPRIYQRRLGIMFRRVFARFRPSVSFNG